MTRGHHPIDASQPSSMSRLLQTHLTNKEPEARRRDAICQTTGALRQDLRVRSSESRPRPLPILPLEEKVLIHRVADEGSESPIIRGMISRVAGPLITSIKPMCSVASVVSDSL